MRRKIPASPTSSSRPSKDLPRLSPAWGTFPVAAELESTRTKKEKLRKTGLTRGHDVDAATVCNMAAIVPLAVTGLDLLAVRTDETLLTAHVRAVVLGRRGHWGKRGGIA